MLYPSARQAALAPPAVPVSEVPAAPPGLALPPAVAAALWRGDQLGRARSPTLSSGFAALDAELPGGGWPCQGLIELLCPQPGTLEWRLLAPLLRALSPWVPPQSSQPSKSRTPPPHTPPKLAPPAQPVLLVGPPHRPHPPGLRADGIAERGLVWLQAHTPAERLWTTEQLLKARAPGVLLAWLPQARPEQLRRLQVLASAGQGPVFICRPQTAAREASAAPLRLLVRVGAAMADHAAAAAAAARAQGADAPTAATRPDPLPGWTLQVDLLKRPGPPLARTLWLPSVPGGLAGLLPPRLRRADLALPTAPNGVPGAVPVAMPATAHTEEEHHVVVRPVTARSSAWH